MRYSFFAVSSAFFASAAEISSSLWNKALVASQDSPLSVVAYLSEQADFSAFSASELASTPGFVYSALKDVAETTQASVISLLQSNPDVLGEIRSLSVVNALVFEISSASVLEVLQGMPSIAFVESNVPFKVALEEPSPFPDFMLRFQHELGLGSLEREEDIQWNIKWVKANQVWDLEFQGEGLIYANADTGVLWKHETLMHNYLGYKSEDSVDHNYAWWDGVKRSLDDDKKPGPCGINSQVPCDDNGHGTHTTSTTVGSKGVGVAPKAKWMACRNMDEGTGSSETYLNCLEFFMAPTDLNGKNPRPELRPTAIGNSYGCPAIEGCAKNAFSKAVENLRAAGIFMSVSAGNDGPVCKSIDTPPGYEPSVISVGALAKNSAQIASYSSRGPSKVKGKTIRKPDVSAPGSQVKAAFPARSMFPGRPPTNPYSTYATLSGTSMASPHVGGAALLMTQACPCIARDIDGIQNVLQDTAEHYTSDQCGGDKVDSVPNNVYGYGGIDILKAVLACQKVCSK